VKSPHWKNVANLVGTGAIVASLIFVGLQLRQAQQVALSVAYQSRADTSLGLIMAALESETLLSAISKRDAGSSDMLTAVEQVALRYELIGELIYLENVHYQHTNGFVTDEQWQANVGDLRRIFAVEVNRQFWDEDRDNWRTSFAEEVEKIIASGQ